MKIICFTESMGGGGAEHQMLLLAEILKQLGYDVTIVTYADIEDHYRIPADINRVRIKESSSKILKLLYIFEYFLFSDAECIISYRQACNVRVLIPLLFRRDVRVICSERNFTYGKPTVYEKLLLSFLYKRANFIVPNSYSQADHLTLVAPQYKNKIIPIINYTDLNHYIYLGIPQNTEKIKICIFSRFSNQKNCLGLADAIYKLKKLTNKNFVFHWYGNGLENDGRFSREYEMLIEKINNLGITNCFILKPAVPDTLFHLEEYHAFCLPSLFEGFSNAVAEAICCGKPMLVSNVSDNHMMVHEGENGFLFNPLNADNIAETINKFLNLTYEQMFEMSKSSRKIAETLFNRDVFINGYKNLIES